MTEKYTPERVAELIADLRGRAESAISHEATDALNAAADALAAVSAERDAEHRRAERLEENRASWVGDAMELVAKAEADHDRLHKAITEALAVVDRHASAELHNETVPLNRLSDLIPEPSSADYRAALDKEGQADE